MQRTSEALDLATPVRQVRPRVGEHRSRDVGRAQQNLAAAIERGQLHALSSMHRPERAAQMELDASRNRAVAGVGGLSARHHAGGAIVTPASTVAAPEDMMVDSRFVDAPPHARGTRKK